MKTMSHDNSNPPVQIMSFQERLITVISHLSAAIPIWGVVANASLFFVFRESSRLICLHARQGILLQLFFLMAAIIWVGTEILARFLNVLQFAENVSTIVAGSGFVVFAFVAFPLWAFCICGAIQSSRGVIFAYPLIGKNSYREYLKATGND